MKQAIKKLCNDIEQLSDNKTEKYLTNLLKHYELIRANGKTDILQAFKNAVIAPNRKERLLNSRHTQMIKKIAQRQKKYSKTYRILMRYKFEIIELYLAGYGVRKIAKELAIRHKQKVSYVSVWKFIKDLKELKIIKGDENA